MPFRHTRWPAVVANAILILAAVALACAPGNESGAPNDPMSINRIAYIDSHGQLVTVNPDGTDRSTLTTGEIADSLGRLGGVVAQPMSETRLYGWPVWSPDGSRIAVSLISGSRPSDAEMSVQSLESSNGVGGPVFVNSAPLTIAEGTPHYVQWSPDSQRLGVTTATPEGLTLYVVDANPVDGETIPSAALPVARGAPLYFDWSPDSRSLAVHSGEELSVLRLNDDATEFSVQSISRSRSFRTPAWSPDGTTLAWSAPGGDSEAVWLGKPDDTDDRPMRLAEVEGACSFLWSSDGRVIAVADRQGDGSPAYRRLRLVAADGSAERTVREDDWVLGFFWEANGTRLAWIALNSEERTMEWRISDGGATESEATEGSTDPVGGLRFSPSGETFLMLAFFDQYARSHSPWAPDGSALVVAGNQQYLSQRRNGSGAAGPHVYVTQLGEPGELRDIAAGGIAVWSPQ
jgi:Tol biopolymer transport system component